MKWLAGNVPGIAASKVSTRVAETARVSAYLHTVPHLRTGHPSPSLKVSQLITGCLSFLLAGLTSCKGIGLGNCFSETLFSYKKQIVAPRTSLGTMRDSGAGAGGGRVGGGRAQL